MKKTLQNFTSKSSIKPELQHARVKDGFIYATDSFKAIKIDVTTLPVEFQSLSTKGDKVVPIDDLNAKGLKDMHYPDIDAIVRGTKDDRHIRFDFEFMERICNSFKRLKKLTKDKGFSHVDMYIGKSDYDPIVLKIKQATVLLMPTYKD